MALSARQRKRYTSEATIYRPTVFGSTIYAKVAEHVKCGIKPTDNYDQVTGRTVLVKQDSVQTSDSIHFEASVDVRSGDVIEIEAGSQQRAGEWFKTTGAPEIHEFRGNFLRLYVNNCKPLTAGQIAP